MITDRGTDLLSFVANIRLDNFIINSYVYMAVMYLSTVIQIMGVLFPKFVIIVDEHEPTLEV